jgi:hypothetical protein
LCPGEAFTGMAYYFFPIRCENLSIDDAQWQRFSTLAEAKAHAAVIAGELAQEGKTYQYCTVCVVTETGQEVARVPINVE